METAPENLANSVTVFRADNRTYDGPITACRHLWGEIGRFKGQIWTVYKQNFRSAYHGTGLGLLWNFILPLVPVTVYLFLSRIRVFPSFEGVDGSTFLTFGVMMWFVLVGFVQLPINIVQSRNNEAMKTSLPISASIVSSFAGLAFDTLVRIVFVFGVMVVTESWPVWTAPALILVFLPSFFLFFGAGLILSIVSVIYRDVSRVVTILLQYGLFVSGVIFPLGSSEIAVLASKLNPFAVFIEASRQIVFQGDILLRLPIAVWSVTGVCVFLVGCRLFYVMEYRIRGID